MPTTEERLAALEKQMAAWIAQQPTTYYTHKYSGEEIDDAVDKIRSGAGEGAVRYDQAQALTPAQQSQAQANIGTTWPCNPNLLDNWYFGNPVNQRGQTEYSGDVYGIDRWKQGANLTVLDGSISLQGNGPYSQIFQGVATNLAGNTLTMSLLCKTSLGRNVALFLYDYTADRGYSPKYSAATRTDDWTLLSCTFAVVNDAPKNLSLIIYPDDSDLGNQTTDILAAKLELGPRQTLAHREGDRWVMNEVPEYGDQLRRCQRYAIDGKYYTTIGKLNYDGNIYYISVQFPFAMRTLPAITLKEISAIGWGVLPISGAELSWVDANGFFVAIKDLSNMDNFIGRSCVVTYFATADL